MCDSYAQFDDGTGLSEKGDAASHEDVKTIQTLFHSSGISDAAPMLAGTSNILGRVVAGWDELSAFEAVKVKTFLREEAFVLLLL